MKSEYEEFCLLVVDPASHLGADLPSDETVVLQCARFLNAEGYPTKRLAASETNASSAR